MREFSNLLVLGLLIPVACGAGDLGLDSEYADHCAICHGVEGAGDGSAASGMNPAPANFTARAFWVGDGVDRGMFEVIKKGGAAVGLSAAMPAWGQRYDDAAIDRWVYYLRARFAPTQVPQFQDGEQ